MLINIYYLILLYIIYSVSTKPNVYSEKNNKFKEFQKLADPNKY